MLYIENKTFDQISVGDHAELSRKLGPQDIELFAVMSGDVNPAHVDEEYAKSDIFHEVIAHGMWGGALISAVLGTELPGPGTIYLNQSLSFRRPVGLGDTVTVRVTVKEKVDAKKRLIMGCEAFNQDGELVIVGEADVIAPTIKVRRPRVLLPEVHLHERGARFNELMAACASLTPITVAVVHPCDELSLDGALQAAQRQLIVPILVGPAERIRSVAAEFELSLDNIEIIDVPHSHAAADRAVELVREGRAQALMKGKLHTDELMSAIIRKDTGIRTERRMSHVYALDVPHYSKLLYITDAAINIYPTLSDKRDIIQNAVDLLRALGHEQPAVAILSAVETINPAISSTLDAAALCKMAQRGQITDARLEGPLAFDNAISAAAAAEKGIVSGVAGHADILVAPDLEAGNMMAKQLIYLAGAEAAGVVLGARVPIILTSRADSVQTRMVSCAIVQIQTHYLLQQNT